MSIGADSIGAEVSWNNQQNKTWLQTSAGTNRYVAVTLAHATGATNYASSVTYDSEALSPLSQQINVLAMAEIWGRANQTTTAGATVAVNMAQGGHYGNGNSASFTEVAQTGSTDAPETFTATGTSDSRAFASASGDAVVSCVSTNAGSPGAVTSGTAIMTISGGLGYGGVAMFGLSTGSTVTLAGSWGNSSAIVHTGVNLNQAGAPPPAAAPSGYLFHLFP